MDELGVCDDNDMLKAARLKVCANDTKQNMTGERYIPLEDDGSSADKLKQVCAQAVKLFENKAEYENTGSVADQSNDSNANSSVRVPQLKLGENFNDFEKWERLPKNRWDFGTLDLVKEHDLELIVEEKFDFLVDDDCQLYTYIILRNGQRRHAAMKGKGLFTFFRICLMQVGIKIQ
jgi:hypothetical protein